MFSILELLDYVVIIHKVMKLRKGVLRMASTL